ncbi:6-hydroxymethylpterin diphosphokinase MptE-like protein [Natronomonas sp. EA1]|uniref:6-hydroxymethylpterin diphosphokinase MptE-like protein n=1 Tax=Natronomonas sp. EA1 TaxID=3421655 RepID=UPI003EBC4E1F
MHYETWSPVYREILDDFGFDSDGDERARDRLAELTEPFDRSRLGFLDGETVCIVGAAPTLPDELDAVSEADRSVVASSAATVLRDHGLTVDVLVTDLDGDPETSVELTHEGTPVAVHAHGDNVPLLERWVPEMNREQVLATTQAEPRAHVHNFGGFTDGDRCAFLADAFGAGTLTFAGWQFDDPSVDAMKAQKLQWAARLLKWLEERRGETFSVLDGLREELEPL